MILIHATPTMGHEAHRGMNSFLLLFFIHGLITDHKSYLNFCFFLAQNSHILVFRESFPSSVTQPYVSTLARKTPAQTLPLWGRVCQMYLQRVRKVDHFSTGSTKSVINDTHAYSYKDANIIYKFPKVDGQFNTFLFIHSVAIITQSGQHCT